MTQDADATLAATLGADYVGVIFAGGPRVVGVERARQLARAARDAWAADATVRGVVGVFGVERAEDIADRASAATLDVVQLHGDPEARLVDDVRERFGGEVWGVLRLDAPTLPPRAIDLFAAADAVVLDAKVGGHQLGGTGVTLPWAALAEALGPHRGRARVVLAGGLRPENVADAVRLLHPDVVDVASGVERAPGIKDPDRMRAFAANARAAQPRPAAVSE
jgi:phosphoribosylanthranilate isomerase